MTDRLSNRDARRLFISLHGLSEPLHRKLTDMELAMRIEQIGFVQIDSVNTVERAHHMILHARNRTYRPEQMARLLEKDRLLFENKRSPLGVQAARVTCSRYEMFRVW